METKFISRCPIATSWATLLWVLVLGSFQCRAMAQQTGAPVERKPDRTTQRWLPLPQTKDGVDLSQQVELLRTIQSLVTRSDEEQLSKFSEDQLQSMERLFDQWKENTGISGMPDLSSIPPEWIDRATQDKQLRDQARRLLQRYAEDRQLPSSGPRSGPSLPLPPELRSQSNGSQDSNPQHSGSPLGSGSLGNGSQSGDSSRGSESDRGLEALGNPFEDLPNSTDGSQQPAEAGMPNRRSSEQQRRLDPFAPRDASDLRAGSDSASQQENPFESARQDRQPNPGRNNPFERSEAAQRDVDDSPSEAGSESNNHLGELIERWRQNFPERSANEQSGTSSQSGFDESRSRQRTPQRSATANPPARTQSIPTPTQPVPTQPVPWSGDRNETPRSQASRSQASRSQASRSQASRGTRAGDSETSPSSGGQPEVRSSGGRDASRGGEALEPSPEQLAQLRRLLEQLARDQQFYERQRSRNSSTQPSTPSGQADSDRLGRTAESSRNQLSQRGATSRGSSSRRSRQGVDQPPVQRYSNRGNEPSSPASSSLPTPSDLYSPSSNGADGIEGNALSDRTDGSSNRYFRGYTPPEGTASKGTSQNPGDVQGQLDDLKMSLEEIGKMFENAGQAEGKEGASSLGSQLADAVGKSNSRSGAGSTRNRVAGEPGENDVASSSGATGSGLPGDVKSQVERFGLGRTLKNIMQETLRREGASTADNSSVGGSSGDGDSRRSEDLAGNPSASRMAGGTSNGSNVNERAGSTAANSPRGNSNSSRRRSGGRNSKSDEGSLSEMASSFWEAVQETPSGRTNRSAGAASVPAGGGFSFAFGWEQLATVLIVAGLIVVALWLARRQFSSEAIAKREETQWAKQAIKAGLQTRKDVVRAYHHLVLRGSEPAPRWWTHRLTENHLRARVPALSPMIGELTSIYEEARYLPPDFRLDEAQVESVRQALQQFEATGSYERSRSSSALGTAGT